MSEDQQNGTGQRPSTRLTGRAGGRPLSVLLWALLLVVIGAGTGWFFLVYRGGDQQSGFDLSEGDAMEEQTIAGDRAVLIAFPEWDATGFVTEERQIPSRDRPTEDLLGIMQSLCEGPSVSGAVSAMPRGTRALGAFIDPQDQSVVLDFSPQLVTGHPGGSLAERITLTSILRTVALNFPETRACVILIEGAQVETLTGHLDMARPFDPREWL